ncbi:hypothetical protein CSKR_200035 [Clonorchis sinensis]|uniref:Zinc finger protein 541 n=1 Tax=Clonorchis sinensis TaxID=79923 RepID=A0A8T1LYP0_CLOSI|nr:hypothetical protein CSKR_200035 [Clonorchis sinensis]
MFSSEFGDLFNGTVDGGSQLSTSDLSMASNLTLLRNVSAAPPSGSLAPAAATATTTAVITSERASPSGVRIGPAQLASATDSHSLEHLFRSDFHHLRPDSQSALPSTLAIPDSSLYPDVSKRHTTMKKEQRSVTEHASLSSSAAGKLNSPNAAVAFPAQTSHARGTLRCPFCDKVFSNSSAIAKHKLTHSEERKYVCSICHKAFKRQDHLNGHKYTHESKKPHACHFCDKSYSDARSLRRHYENAHPEEYERWLILSQATNGDPSAITVAAVALLSSSRLVDKEEPGSAQVSVTTTSNNTGENNGSANHAAGSQTSDALPPDPSALLSALSSPVCKLLASSLSRAAAQNKTDDSPASNITIDGQATGNDPSSVLRRSEHRGHRGLLPRSEVLGATSPHSPNSGCCSLSSVASPTETMDTADFDEADDRNRSGSGTSLVSSLSSLTPAEVATATKVALMMVHPLEAPKRVACKVCRKRFKNQSALNGHMRLHGGYGPAGLAAPHTGTVRNSEDHAAPSGSTTVQIDSSNSQLRPPESQSSSGPTSTSSYSPPLPAVTTTRLDPHDMARLDEVLETLSTACSKQSVTPHSAVHLDEEHVGSSSSTDTWILAPQHQQQQQCQVSSSKCSQQVESDKLLLLSPAYPSPPCYPGIRSEKAGEAILRSSEARPPTERNSWHHGQASWWHNNTSATSDGGASGVQPNSTVPTACHPPWWNCPTPSGVSERLHSRVSEDQQLTPSSSSRRPTSSMSNSSTSERIGSSRPLVRSDHKSERAGLLVTSNRNCSEDEWRRRISEATGLTDGYENVMSRRDSDPQIQVDVCTTQLQQPFRPVPLHHPNSSVFNKCNVVSRPLSNAPPTLGTAGGSIWSSRDPLRPQLTLPSINSSSSCGQQTNPGLDNQYSPVTPASGGTSLPMDSGEHPNTVFAFPPSEQHIRSLSTGLPSHSRSMAQQSLYPSDHSFVGNNLNSSQLVTMLDAESVSSGLAPQQLKVSNEDISLDVPQQPPISHLNHQQPALRHSVSIPQLGHLEFPWPSASFSKSEPGCTVSTHTSFGRHQQLTVGAATAAFQPHFNLTCSVVDSICCNPSNTPRSGSPVLSVSGGNVRPKPHSVSSWAHHRQSCLDSRNSHSQVRSEQPLLSTHVAAPFRSHPNAHSYIGSSQQADSGAFGPRRQSLQQEQPGSHFIPHTKTQVSTLHSSQSYPALEERHSLPMDYTYQPKPHVHRSRACNYSVTGEDHLGFPASRSGHHLFPHNPDLHALTTQQSFSPLEPERTRHISAPMVQPCVGYSQSHDHTSHVTLVSSSSSVLLPLPNLDGHLQQTARESTMTSFILNEQDSIRMRVSPDLAASDAVADLLMQSHITDPQNFSCTPNQLGKSDSTSLHDPLHIDADYANQVAHACFSTPTPNSVSDPLRISADQVRSNATTTTTTPNSVIQEEAMGCVPLTGPERFELADLAMGTGSADESDNSAVTRLSKSLAEDNLFRNPHTLPPPKKFKRKPAPIFIPPQTSANLSRLRSPRVWTSECSSMGSSPPPYTPPPMLSPNRRGSGLFSSLTRWSSITSPLSLNRRNSSYYPTSATGDYFRRRSLMIPSSAHGGTPTGESEGALKRSYLSSITGSSSSQTITCSAEPKNNTEGRRTFAFPRRRRQLTPKSAPMVLLDTSYSEKLDLNTGSPLAPQPPAQQDTSTVFGYDDETMRKFAEADAAERARRLGRRRCDTDSHRPTDTTGKTALDTSRQDGIPVKLSKLEQGCDTLMNYKSEDALELVEDTLAGLDEEMHTTELYIEEDDDLDEEEEEEGLPSSLIPRINIGDAFQAEIPDYCPDRVALETETEARETLLWFPANLDDRDPKNIESLNLLMKIACSPAVRSCGLNMEYTFHLLCKYKGNLEMTLHALLYETLVVYDYVYAETTAWTTEEIARFQHGLRLYGRDFHQVAKDLQANGMNKTVKACVEFYYVWKRMNTPSDVKWYRERARRQRLARGDVPVASEMETQQSNNHGNVTKSTSNQPSSVTDTERLGVSTYNLRRKPPAAKADDNHLSALVEKTADVAQLEDLASLGLDNLPVYDSHPCDEPPDLSLLAQVEEEFNLANGSDGGYPCHICHRVFSKVKSRSAHMKSHSDRSSNHNTTTVHTRTPTPYAK